MKDQSLAFTAAVLGISAFAIACHANAQTPAPSAAAVTVDNFVRAETDSYIVKLSKPGGVGKLNHSRELAPIDKQSVIRMNRDTLYSNGVFDLDAGPVTITMPDPGKRYVSLAVLDEDHYTQALYHGGGTYTLTRENVGTRYAIAIVRMFVDPASADDLKQVHALQDAIKVSQKETGKLELPQWDPASLKKVREPLLELAATTPNADRTFGTRSEVDPVRHLLGTAFGWGGLPEKEATYVSITPRQNDGKTIYRLSLKDAPVNAFWSISVYNAKGYFEKNAEGAYTINNVTAKRDSDGAITVQFGGCESGKIANCLPITPGWNYLERMYQPRAEILSGAWKFPEARPVN
ncbi:DUF1254 domain-containing protein [Burkholderia guangdongensis]|uniref:DUF1254 domain-containing protein n=1 Tax=Burkholderia guangdongensis TaxID=1792500 RepID=UPI0015CBF588|nr:DUF1254 domain-containing protein [Burkholderia guangdongensis]